MTIRGNVLTEVTDANLAQAAGWNHVAWITALGRLPTVELHVESDAVWTIARRPSWHNHVCALRLLEGEAEKRLREILASYRRARLAANIWQDAGATPADLSDLLRARGLRCTKHFPVMALDLVAGEVKEEPLAPPNLTLERVQDFSRFEGAVHPFLGSVTSPSQRAQLAAYRELEAQNADTTRHLLALRENRPVGVGTLFGAAGVAGVYDVGVVEPERRHGVGTAITRQLLEHARELGYRAVVLLSSGMAEGLYSGLGFRQVTTVSHWFYSRARQRREEIGE